MSAVAASVAALWLGVLTSISPCPLTTNIAAVSYIGRSLDAPSSALISGITYTLGRAVAYALLAAVLITSLLSIPETSLFLQKYMNKLLGPVLIVAGMFLAGLISVGSFGFTPGERFQKHAVGWGYAGAALLGFGFALSFCPVSAALFFGSLLPLSIEHESRFMLPLLYGVGTGLPVLIFAGLVAAGSRSLGIWFNRLTAFERWARHVTGVIFILAGIYLTLIHIFGWA